jgi:hypothetical protein
MRTTSLAVLTLAACTSLLHAATNREATYVVGNLDNLEPGAEGTVHIDGDGLTFRSGKVTIEAPYAKIATTEMGPTLTHNEDVPLYKVWQLRRRFADRTMYQNFTVNFKDSAGNDHTMTLEVTAAAAAELHETLERRTGQKARSQQTNWWGDDLWRTNRNHQDWDQSAALGSR